MFFRFGTALVLVVIVSLLGIALEKRILSQKRTISLQHYRFEQLHERRARLRVRSEELGAPARLIDAIDTGAVELELAREELDDPESRPQ
jgi:hypothetical protein